MRLRRRTSRTSRRSVVLLVFMAMFMMLFTPAASAYPSPSDACQPAPAPAPEAYGSGSDGLIKPPDYPTEAQKHTQPSQLTYYDRYGTAGQSWYAVDMGCGDAMSLMGNSVANTVFTLVRAIDRTTISVYQAAASESLLGWLKNTVDDVIKGMGSTFNARYWTPVVILGAITLAWWGLVRRRTSKVAEGTIWMVAAMVGLIWLISRPGDFTTLGTTVSNATTTAFNAALPQSSAGTTCIPPAAGQPALDASKLDPTTRNANGLWVALVCKPWLMGEFGTTDPNAKIVKDHAAALLGAQAVDLPEAFADGKPDLGAKSDAYIKVAKDIKENYPGVYPVFQGKQWTSRLAVAFGGLFAALIAGLLILVIAIALIIVKISFLMLLVAGPIFLGIGIHPGIGRVIAIRWLELLLSMLLKQAALIGVLAMLLWAYGLILGEGLPWGLQIMLIALVTAAAFVYRKPFQHLFAAVGYSAVSKARSENELEKSITAVRKSTVGVAQAATPGAALSRLVRKEPAPALAGMSDDAAAGSSALTPKLRAAEASGSGRAAGTAPPLNLPSSRTGVAAGSGSANGGSAGGGSAPPRKGGTASPGKSAAGSGGGGSAPPRKGGGTGTPSKPAAWGGSGGGTAPGSGRVAEPPRGTPSRPADPPKSGAGRTAEPPKRSRVRGGGSPAAPSKPAPAAKPAPTAKSDPAAGAVPRPRPAASAPRDQAPPLWAKRVSDQEPPTPFWLRPTDSDE